ncbi:MAG: hypothetical protein GOV00_02065 [Candidatus Altiarchaeota archaeon]|nr:hypothetical protein [Candidatus Altiarchaeota archaeon]
MILTDLYYGGKDKVVTTLVGQNGQTMKDSEFLPYIYVIVESSKAIENLEKLKVGMKPAEKIEVVKKIDLNKEVEAVKITVRHPKEIQEWRAAVKPYGERREYDIPFVKRYMIDHKLKPLVEVTDKFERGTKEIESLRVLAFDIETLSKSPSDIGGDPITMISAWGEGLEKVITWAEVDEKNRPEWLQREANEAAMIKAFVRLVNEYKPSVIVGYNSDAFDWAFIAKRAEKLGILPMFNGRSLSFVRRGRGTAPYLPGMNPVDLYIFIRNILAPYLQAESLDLGTIANELVGETKTAIGGAEGMREAWENPDKLHELFDYSLQDAKITYLLAEKVLPMIYELSKLVGQTVFDVSRLPSGQMVEWLLMKAAFDKNMLIPPRPRGDVFSERYTQRITGAFVKDPVKGLHHRVAVCDFRSLYPTIIIAHNISPDAVGCEHEACEDTAIEGGAHFCKKTRGFMPELMKGIFDRRMEIKDGIKRAKRGSKEWVLAKAKSNALKLILNSFYGYLGFAGSRWYTLEGAQAITAWGRHYIKEIMKIAEGEGFTVIYGDTDSIMLNYPESHSDKDFENRVGDFMKRVNDSLPKPIQLDLEGIFKTGLFVTKKRYALMRKDGSMVVKGLERVRRDWSPLARTVQDNALRLILDDRVDEAKELVRNKVKALRDGKIPIKDLIITTQLTKAPEEYAILAPHVKVAKDMRKEGEPILPGMLIKYVVQPGKGTISSRAIWAKKATKYDVDYYIGHQLIPPLLRLMEVFGESERSLNAKQAGLDGFL